LAKGNLLIRNAMESDAKQLCEWWNDGKIMAHAGFYDGVNDTVENIVNSLKKDTDEIYRRHIIEFNQKPIGEMNYRKINEGVVIIGIKICDFSCQEKGLGTTLLEMFIDSLFMYYEFEKVTLDTNLTNTRAQHVYENKLGFTKVRVNENVFKDSRGELQSSVDFEITKNEWLEKGKTIDYLHIRNERPEDEYEVENLTRETFWSESWTTEPKIIDEHFLVSKIRKCKAYVPELNFIAEYNGELVGHIIYSKSKVVDEDENEFETLTFGPLSVLPKFQNTGFGKSILYFSLGVAKRLLYRGVIIFGHPDYYPRVGFKRAGDFGITAYDGSVFDPFMAYPLYEGAFEGVKGKYFTDPVYDNLPQEECIEFDKKFPPKELPIATPISVLIDELTHEEQNALNLPEDASLAIIHTKSVNSLLKLHGITDETVKKIHKVMKENGREWGRFID